MFKTFYVMLKDIKMFIIKTCTSFLFSFVLKRKMNNALRVYRKNQNRQRLNKISVVNQVSKKRRVKNGKVIKSIEYFDKWC